MERPSLRLPAPPPAKRQRTAVLDTLIAATAAALPEASHGAAAAVCPSPTDDDVAAERDVPEALPNDAMVALLLLKSRFPSEAKVIPFATRSQLYTLLSDRTAADRQIEELRRGNRVRLIQLPGAGRGGEEHALVLTEDYVAALRRCRAVLLQQHRQQQQQQGGSSGAGGGSTAGSSGSTDSERAAPGLPHADQPPGIEAFGWFAMRVLPSCTETMITHGELLSLLGRGSGTGNSKPGTAVAAVAAGVRLGAAAGPAAARAAAVAAQRVTDAHVSLLLSCGFLARHTASADSYLFGMPQAGAAVRSVAAGRQEILSLLQRRRQPELLEAELAKRTLQRSVLGVRWHVAEMVGSGALLRLTTPVGPLLRVAKRGG